ncbi:MAG: hypothetical protein K6B17_08610 [Treponema sp.]|nr:hypothetical protein [Treponema sp.]
MKKKIIFVVFSLLLSAAVFAERQTTLNYAIGGYSVDVKGDFDAKLTYGFSPFGLACSNQWFKDSAESKFNVGFDLKFGMWLSADQEFDDVNDSDWFNLGEYLSLGPVFRLCMDENNYIYLTPGAQIDLIQGFYTGSGVTSGKTIGFDFAFSLDVAYRHWFNEHFGLNLGLDLDVLIAGYYMQSYEMTTTTTTTYTYDGPTGSGFAYRFLVGFSMR